MTKQEKRQMLVDLIWLKRMIEREPELKYRVLNYPQKPELTPLTLITRSIRTARRIKPI